MQLNFFEEDEDDETTKMKKNIIIENHQINYSQQYQVYIPYDSVVRQLDLGYVLDHIFYKLFNQKDKFQIFYFNTLSGYFQYGGIYPFKQPLLLGEQFIPKQEIYVTFRKIVFEDQPNNFPIQEIHKKKRITDRSIKDISQKVSAWRQICHQQKLTYQQAAKQIDIPKKTLDDYYYLIKMGEQFGFDFQKNMNQKIGILRKFVKEQKKCSKEYQKSGQIIKIQENQPQQGSEEQEQQEEQ